ncbi:hypothetical protein HanRHA438_Chr10g0442121 [Helianthus annuus]|nr:hypothetical protein HanRHA438_Chr10g0442121 [Helianthus annuus]
MAWWWCEGLKFGFGMVFGVEIRESVRCRWCGWWCLVAAWFSKHHDFEFATSPLNCETMVSSLAAITAN